MTVRIGEVNSANYSKRLVRVYFSELEIMSGWLKVITSPPFIVPDPPEVEVITSAYKNETNTGVPACSGACGAECPHRHDLRIVPWFPKIGDQVLCIYNEGFNEDGFVIGGIK